VLATFPESRMRGNGVRRRPQPAPHAPSSYFVLKLQLDEPVPIRLVPVERTP
jgi:hypothetical protein